MDADAVQDDESAPTWDLADTLTVTEVRAAGGIFQHTGGADPSVFLEVAGSEPGSDDPPVTCRLVLSLPLYFKLMAAMEHAGKVALLMPTDSD